MVYTRGFLQGVLERPGLPWIGYHWGTEYLSRVVDRLGLHARG